VNGIIYQDVMLTSTYTINPDCTGSSTQTDAGNVDSGTAVRLSN